MGRRIITLFAAGAALFLNTTASFARTESNETSDEVTRKGSVLAINGQKMSREATYDYIETMCYKASADRWAKSSRLYRTGTGLLITSGVTLVAGTSLATVGVAYTLGAAIGGGLGSAIGGVASGGNGGNEMDPQLQASATKGAILLISGATLCAASIALMIPGAICVPVGKARMNTIAEQCSGRAQSTEVTMNFGACRNGIGVAINF